MNNECYEKNKISLHQMITSLSNGKNMIHCTNISSDSSELVQPLGQIESSVIHPFQSISHIRLRCRLAQFVVEIEPHVMRFSPPSHEIKKLCLT